MQAEKKYKVALVQMDSGIDKEKNLEKAVSAIRKATAQGAKLICFPELMNGESKEKNVLQMAEGLEEKTISILKAEAKNCNVYIHSGSMYEKIECYRN